MKSITEKILDHPFFAGMEGEHLAKVAMGGRFSEAFEKEVAPDEIIFEQGGSARAFYLIDGGRDKALFRTPALSEFSGKLGPVCLMLVCLSDRSRR